LGRQYLAGLAAVAIAGAAVTLLVSPAERRAAWFALGAAVIVQGPIGWWLVGAVGGPRFLRAWVVGMGTRVALFALFALVLVPALGLPVSSTLFPLVMALMALLIVEVIVVNRGLRRAGAR
jgi:hypothetical protein